jgi:Plectin/S10 domain
LTNEGIEYLRQYLHLPPEIVPTTLKRTARSETARPRAAPRSDGQKGGEDRQAYRRTAGQGQDKKADVGAGAGDLELVSFIPHHVIAIKSVHVGFLSFSVVDSVVDPVALNKLLRLAKIPTKIL